MKQKVLLLSVLILSVSFYSHAQSNTVGSGIALQFNGSTSNYVDLGDVFNSLAFPFSFEAWVNIPSLPPVTNILFSSDNSNTAYSGWVIHINSSGLVDFEFANNSGSGSENRRGILSAHATPLNEWFHIACVANSPSEMHIYINGVNVATTLSGSNTLTDVAYTSSHAFIGRRIDFYSTYTFNGQMDEIRLWNTSRGQEDIRSSMCRKVDPSSNGLIGYWTADESYTSNTVLDNTVPAENGTIVGTVTKITSGAAIGDASEYLYTDNWSGKKVMITSSGGDNLSAKNILGNPYGVHVYRVDAKPYYTAGLQTTPDYYFGVFCAEAEHPASFKAIYTYSENNGIITEANESSAQLKKRVDNSINWTMVYASPDTATRKFSNKEHQDRKEYILNIPSDMKMNFSSSSNATTSGQQLTVFPNPASQQISIAIHENTSILRIEEINGKILKSVNLNEQNQSVTLDVSDLKNGSYLLEALSLSGWKAGQFQVQR